MANYFRRKTMEKLRNLWLSEFTKEINIFRAKEGKEPIKITDCITLSFYLFNFLPPGQPKEGSKETGALACTFKSLTCPPEELDEKERDSLHQLVDKLTLKKDSGYTMNDVKDISATLNFQNWSITAIVTLKQKDEAGKNIKDTQIWN